MKKFVITAESDFEELEFHTNDVAVACEMFEVACSDAAYYSVDLLDGETGEVYAYQKVERDPWGTKVTRWVAN